MTGNVLACDPDDPRVMDAGFTASNLAYYCNGMESPGYDGGQYMYWDSYDNFDDIDPNISTLFRTSWNICQLSRRNVFSYIYFCNKLFFFKMNYN